MDPSDFHQPFDFTTITSTYVPEDVTAPHISPLATPTGNELNLVESHVEPAVQPHVEPAVQPHVEPAVQPHVEPHAASESALVPAQPTSNRRPYTNMIYDALVALNEPEGSSKWAISSYIRRSNPNIPDAHEALMDHHLEVMKRCGILTRVKKSYKLAYPPPPENVAAAVDSGPVAVSDAVADTGLVVASGSEIPPTYTGPLDMVVVTASGSASQPQKRRRGRPAKPKTKAPQQQQPIAAQPISEALPPSINVEPSAVQPSGEQPELPVTNPTLVVAEKSAKRGPGRPRKDGSGPSVQAPSLAVMMKRRGWPMSCRGSGRERDAVSPESPRRGGSGGVATLAPAGEEAMAVADVMKRGRGRSSKRGRGRTAVRPIQDTPNPVTRATGAIQEPDYGEVKRLKTMIQIANKRIKEIMYVLDVGIATGDDNQTVANVSQALGALVKVLTLEPHAMEEVQPEKAEPQTQAETQGMELGQGSGGGGEQAQIQNLILTQPQPEALTQPQPQTLLQLQPETLILPQTLSLIQPQTLSEPHPQTMPLPQTLTLTEPEPQILHELEPQTQTLPEFEPLPELENLIELDPLPLTQPQPQMQPQIQPNIEAEAMDEDMF